MANSPDRILTTHVGSLVRPPKLVEFLHRIEDRQPYDQAGYEACLGQSIEEVVRQQADAGVDIVSDGEFSKGRNWAFYVHDRLTGVATRPLTPEEAKDPMASAGGGQDRVAFPEFYAEYDRQSGLGARLGRRFVVNGALTYSDAQVKRDIANLKSAVAKAKVAGAFLPVVAPASALPGAKNEHYPDEKSLLFALADCLHQEYKAIIDAGLYVQVDDAFLPYMHEKMVPPMSEGRYRAWAQMRIDALNHALKGIPQERSRYHICWGSWNGPHAFDVPMKDIVDLLLQVRGGQSSPRARMGGVEISEAAAGQSAHPRGHQPRHQHRRASGAGGAAPGAPRQDRRTRERHGRHRLRLRPEPVCSAGPPDDHVGEAQVAGRRRPDRHAGIVGPALGSVSFADLAYSAGCCCANSDVGSTFTPGPIVDEMATRLMK
jgi:5-methyltetrahydropteroyltriglutamate--homocysteine methyltransferase